MLILKGLVGFFITILIVLVSKTNNYFIAGLLPLFPAFSLIAQISVGQSGSSDMLKTTALFGILSLIPYFFYLLSVYILADKLSLLYNLLASTLIWTASALILVFLWNNKA